MIDPKEHVREKIRKNKERYIDAYRRAIESFDADRWFENYKRAVIKRDD